MLVSWFEALASFSGRLQTAQRVGDDTESDLETCSLVEAEESTRARYLSPMFELLFDDSEGVAGSEDALTKLI